jgi:pyruvate formate lyase activating enzyme
VLTITSNVVYGKATGNTPDGRREGEPFAPGANPMHGRDSHGWLAVVPVGRAPALLRGAGRDQLHALGGSIGQPRGRGRSHRAGRGAIDMFFGQGGFHLNFNVLRKETLLDAMENPDKYPQLTIRVSGYAVNFIRLTREQQLDVVNRSFFHGKSDVAARRHRRAEAELPQGSRYDLRHDLSPDAPDVENYSEGDGAFGYAHSYETGSSVDGPGIRITLFLSGCPLKCQYCHNPDTWRLKHGVRSRSSASSRGFGHFAPALRAMKGGLTISGGEVLLQAAFSRRILGAAKKMGLHTCIQTSGFLGARADDEYLQNLDLVIMDLKSGDPETYRRVTGQELAPTLRFAERLAAMNKPMWIRFTLVPGLTDDPRTSRASRNSSRR